MISVRNLAGALVGCKPMMRNAANELVPVSFEVRNEDNQPVPTTPPVPTLTASASPTQVSGAISRNGTGNATTNAATVTAFGGVPPYSYEWVSQEGMMTALNPNGATTAFAADVEGGGSVSDTFYCTVNDSAGSTASANVAATVYNYGKAL